jgi:hypothetical protein
MNGGSRTQFRHQTQLGYHVTRSCRFTHGGVRTLVLDKQQTGRTSRPIHTLYRTEKPLTISRIQPRFTFRPVSSLVSSGSASFAHTKPHVHYNLYVELIMVGREWSKGHAVLDLSSSVIASLNPDESKDVCPQIFTLCCPVQVQSLQWADHNVKNHNQLGLRNWQSVKYETRKGERRGGGGGNTVPTGENQGW